MGKSTCIVEWLRAFVQVPDLQDEGVIICLDRYDEIERFINGAQLPESLYAVFVTETNLLNKRGLGREKTTSARILYATKIEIRDQTRVVLQRREMSSTIREGQGASASGTNSFWLVAPLTLGRTDLRKLLSPFDRHQNSEGSHMLLDTVESLLQALKE